MALTFSYTKTPVALDRLIYEIQTSAIPVALDLATTTAFGSQLTVGFKADLADSTVLDALVAAHSGAPLPQNTAAPVAVTTMPDPAPFALPLYRTKRNAVDNLVSIQPGEFGDIDFKMLAERYVSGGAIIIENAELGDYVVATVEDVDGLIPLAYRAALCEDYPHVAAYIVKEFVHATNPGTIQAGGISVHEIDTSPLNAKITAGLYLCVEYHAVASGLTRRVGVNYRLTKKL
jgi:hypothetical protein